MNLLGEVFLWIYSTALQLMSGWIHDSVLSLREVGLSYLPDDIKRPAEDDKIQEAVIPLDYANAVWLPKAIQDTADIRKKQR